jgi:hypothetical protein
MGRSQALRGVTLRKFFSPFYSTARRNLGLSPAVVDRCIAAHATARIDGRTVTITEPGGTEWQGKAPLWRGGSAARWVNEFNWRAMGDRGTPPAP